MLTNRLDAKGRLALAGLICFAAAPCFAVDDSPATIDLTGVVRDFRRAHPDFNAVPVGGFGHYAGNVSLTLGADERPDFIGGGYRVEDQWRDSKSRPFAPHLYWAGGGVFKLVNDPKIDNNPQVDTWDSSEGPYGGDNVGPAPFVETGSEMPKVDVPTGLPWTDELNFDGNGSTVLSADIHCNKFEIINNHTVWISGNVKIVADELFKVTSYGKLELLPGASLEIYALKDGEITNYANVNVEMGKPPLVMIHYLGIGEFNLSNHADVYAQIIAPTGGLLIENNSNLFGNYTGQDFRIKNTGGFHVDTSGGGLAPDVCGTIADLAGTAGVTSDGGISSSDSFDEWYRDMLGVNLAMEHTITLTLNGTVYEYLDDGFHPVDGYLFGNEGDDHNNYFTYAISAEFVYERCTGQFLEFVGTDDTWLFIDGELVMDLGGVQPDSQQYVDLDRLGLKDGDVYEAHFFHAQRQPLKAVFQLRTNIVFFPNGPMAVVNLPCD